MAPSDTSCIFCKKHEWNEKDKELLNWAIENLNGRLDTRVCFEHNQQQIERLTEARNKVLQESRRRTTPVEEAKQKIYWDHYNALHADQKRSGRCCVVM